MNPSYENGGQNTPGVKPGVIASGPDSEDVPPKPIVTPSGLSIGSSRQPTGGRPMAVPVENEPRSNKNGLIIGGVIAGVVAIVAVVILLILINNGGGNQNNGTVDAASFNRLINYVTTGEELDTGITEYYDDLNGYYFSSDFETEEEKVIAYDTTKNLLEKFVSSYQNGDDQTLNDLVKTVKQMYDFMYVVNLKAPISESDATKKMIENGTTTAAEELLSYYDFSGLTDNTYVQLFSSFYADWASALSEEVNFFRNNNCISGSYMVLSCMANKNDESIATKWKELEKKVGDSYSAWGAYLNTEDNFVANVYAINGLIQGKSTIVAGGEANE